MKRLWLLVLIPVIGLVWWLVARKGQPKPTPFAYVKRETLTSTLPTNAKVEPLDFVTVRVDTPGLVTRVLVKAAQAVRRGALLAQISEPGLAEELNAAEARQVQSQGELDTLSRGGRTAELTDIENSLNRTKFDRDEAAREYNSLKRLQEKQAATPVEVEAARAKLRQAEIDMESLTRRRSALVSKTDVAVGQAKVRESQAAVQSARARLGRGAVVSPIAGTVYSLPARQGTYLNAGDPVASVGNLDRLRIRVYVDEPELGRVEIGQPVRITWDALPGREWTGVVEKKPTEIVPLGTRQVGEVLCTIDNPGRELVPGTSVNAEIRTNVVANALTIPKESLRRNVNGAGVFVLRDNRIRWQPVKLGASSVTRATITSGLKDGDAVALPTEQNLKDGESVAPVFP